MSLTEYWTTRAELRKFEKSTISLPLLGKGTQIYQWINEHFDLSNLTHFLHTYTSCVRAILWNLLVVREFIFHPCTLLSHITLTHIEQNCWEVSRKVLPALVTQTTALSEKDPVSYLQIKNRPEDMWCPAIMDTPPPEPTDRSKTFHILSSREEVRSIRRKSSFDLHERSMFLSAAYEGIIDFPPCYFVLSCPGLASVIQNNRTMEMLKGSCA